MSSPSQAPTQRNPVLDYYQEWSSRTPLVTRSSMIFLVVCYILSFFFNADQTLGNVTYFTVMKLEIYRIFLSPLVGNSLLIIVLTALFFPVMGGRMEYSLGSSKFLVLMALLSLVTNIIFSTICLTLSFVGTPEALFWSCSGFWVILFGLITIECMQAPDQPRRLLFIPIDFPSKYYPLILFVFFSLFSGPQLSFAISMLLGYVHSKGAFDKFLPSSQYLQQSEATGMMHSLSGMSGWVMSSGRDEWIPLNTIDREDTYDNSSGGSAGGRSGFPAPGVAGPAASGGSRISGLGWPGSSSAGEAPQKKEEKKEMFPGAGHTLTSGGNSGSIASRFLPSKSSAAPGGLPLDRETLARQRMAALGQQQQQQQQQQYRPVVEPSAPPASIDQLTDMGYERHDAQRALDMAGGSLEGALQLLTV